MRARLPRRSLARSADSCGFWSPRGCTRGSGPGAGLALDSISATSSATSLAACEVLGRTDASLILAKEDENDKPMFVERLTPERAFAMLPGTDVRATNRRDNRPLGSPGVTPPTIPLAHLGPDRIGAPGARIRARMGRLSRPANDTASALRDHLGRRRRNSVGDRDPQVSECRPPFEDRSDRTAERAKWSGDPGRAAVEGAGGMTS